MDTVITDQMLLSFHVSKQTGITIEIAFQNEEELAKFGHEHLAGASVAKVEAINQVHYEAVFLWRKRPIRLLMRVDISIGAPAREVFSGDTAAD